MKWPPLRWNWKRLVLPVINRIQKGCLLHVADYTMTRPVARGGGGGLDESRVGGWGGGWGCRCIIHTQTECRASCTSASIRLRCTSSCSHQCWQDILCTKRLLVACSWLHNDQARSRGGGGGGVGALSILKLSGASCTSASIRLKYTSSCSHQCRQDILCNNYQTSLAG